MSLIIVLLYEYYLQSTSANTWIQIANEMMLHAFVHLYYSVSLNEIAAWKCSFWCKIAGNMWCEQCFVYMGNIFFSFRLKMHMCDSHILCRPNVTSIKLNFIHSKSIANNEWKNVCLRETFFRPYFQMRNYFCVSRKIEFCAELWLCQTSESVGNARSISYY